MNAFQEIGRDILKRDVFMKVAIELSRLGTCPRKAVGAVLIRDGRAISWGFNGAPPGLPHCDKNGHGWGVYFHEEGKPDLRTMIPDFAEKAGLSTAELEHMPWDWRGGTDYLASLRGCRNATHAEANALAFAARQGISTDNSILFVTVAPCDVCAKLLIAAGVRRVYYEEEYRDPAGIELLRLASIKCIHHQFHA
jgi:dCMP deaminase